MDVLNTVAPSEGLERAADGSIAVGIVAGLGAAVSGLADWQHLIGHERRLGLMHGLLNVGTIALYSTSLSLRLRKRRTAGVGTAMVAYALASLAAYLGGELVFGAGVGVNRIAWKSPPTEFVPVLPEAALEENTLQRVQANGTSVLLIRRHGQIHALAETCTHLGGPLAEGETVDDSVVCPWHGSRFALEDGHVLRGPATFPQRLYDVRVRDGQIEVRAQGYPG